MTSPGLLAPKPTLWTPAHELGAITPPTPEGTGTEHETTGPEQSTEKGTDALGYITVAASIDVGPGEQDHVDEEFKAIVRGYDDEVEHPLGEDEGKAAGSRPLTPLDVSAGVEATDHTINVDNAVPPAPDDGGDPADHGGLGARVDALSAGLAAATGTLTGIARRLGVTPPTEGREVKPYEWYDYTWSNRYREPMWHKDHSSKMRVAGREFVTGYGEPRFRGDVGRWLNFLTPSAFDENGHLLGLSAALEAEYDLQRAGTSGSRAAEASARRRLKAAHELMENTIKYGTVPAHGATSRPRFSAEKYTPQELAYNVMDYSGEPREWTRLPSGRLVPGPSTQELNDRLRARERRHWATVEAKKGTKDGPREWKTTFAISEGRGEFRRSYLLVTPHNRTRVPVSA